MKKQFNNQVNSKRDSKNFESNLKNFEELKNSNNDLKGNFTREVSIHTIFQIVVIIKNFYA